MENIYEETAAKLTQRLQEELVSQGNQQSAPSPVVFVFLGETAVKARKGIQAKLKDKWTNVSSLSFLEFSNIPAGASFEDVSELVDGVNTAIDAETSKISRVHFREPRRISVVVVCAPHEEENAVLVDIGALLRCKLGEYSYMTMDLFALLDDEKPCPHAAVFFDALENAQQSGFLYEKNTLRNGGALLPARLGPGRLFNNVYLQGKKNYNKFISDRVAYENENIIALITYVKSQGLLGYDGGELWKQGFACSTAGYAYVHKPAGLIANRLLQCFFDRLFSHMKETGQYDKDNALGLLGADYHTVRNCAVVRGVPYEDYLAVMPAGSLDNLHRQSRETVLASVYGGNMHEFFDKNVRNPYLGGIRQQFEYLWDIKTLLSEILNKNRITLATANRWLAPEGDLMEAIGDCVRSAREGMRRIEEQAADKLRGRPGAHSGFKSKTSEKAHLLLDVIAPIFSLEAEKLETEAVLGLYEHYEREIPLVREEFARLSKKISAIGNGFAENFQQALETADYTAGGSYDIYQERFDEMAREYKDRTGEDFVSAVSRKINLFEMLLSKNEAEIVRELSEVFWGLFGSSKTLRQVAQTPFDEELKNRDVKMELFGNLAKTSVLNLDFVKVPQRSENSKIYIGDGHLEFTRFAIKSENESTLGGKSYLLEERGRGDGIEKINVYTGLCPDDVNYINQCRDILNSVKEQGGKNENKV